MDRRGLIISYYFPPQGGGGVQRWVKFIKYLSRMGWRFDVITAPPVSSLPIDESLITELPPSISVSRIPEKSRQKEISRLIDYIPRGYIARWIGAFFYVTDSRCGWNQYVRNEVTKQLKKTKIDLLVFTIPPYSLAMEAAYFARSQSVPVLLDFRDPWTKNPYKIYPSPYHTIIDVKREKNAVKNVDFITSAYQSVLEDFRIRIPGFTNKAFAYIPNGYDEEDFAQLSDLSKTEDHIFKIGFSGSFYSHFNHPETVFKAIQLLKQKGIEVQFHHYGSSVYKLKRLARKHGVDNSYQNHGYLEHKNALQAMMQMDASCLILDDRQKNADHTVGGKLYEYLRLKKPIVAVVPENGEAAHIIRETDSGLICGRDPSHIAEKIEQIVSKASQFSFRNIEKFSRKSLAIKLNEFFNKNILH